MLDECERLRQAEEAAGRKVGREEDEGRGDARQVRDTEEEMRVLLSEMDKMKGEHASKIAQVSSSCTASLLTLGSYQTSFRSSTVREVRD